MITMAELLKGAKLEDQTPEIQESLKILLEKINKVRAAYNKPMTPTSGLRTMADHLRIYEDIAKKKGEKFDKSKVPMKSTHLFGQAVDIFDPKRELQKWIQENIKLMEEIGLWFEDFSVTTNWVHFQINPPKSGKRFFMP